MFGSYGHQIFGQQAGVEWKARWILLLEEFDYTVEYKPGRMHLQADHLSRLSKDMGTTPIDDSLIDDRLFVVTYTPDWYARIVEFLKTQQLPVEWTKEDMRKVRVNNRHFAMIGNKLLKKGADTILRRCVTSGGSGYSRGLP